eukprot:TRINITY_DN124045_c0_g1_i1.p1 TRINITY_DN124045_c0_g1~~TRINITY_DN124045_c0_g1_i1.p1  ORF type:complete len:334 (+),score=32.54 TRINITY_DN124045_c0_g1_i1:57-1058(+)
MLPVNMFGLPAFPLRCLTAVLLLLCTTGDAKAKQKQMNCYQQPHTDYCCMDPGMVTVSTKEEKHCNIYGHLTLRRSRYLRPNFTRRSPGQQFLFQTAFLNQGIYNTHSFSDCRWSWLGVTIRNPPQDTMLAQQLISQLRPGLFIETGTYRGGMAFFVATVFHLLDLKDSRVITIDILQKENAALEAPSSGACNKHEFDTQKHLSLGRDKIWQHYVREVVASSLSETARAVVADELALIRPGAPVLISLDGDHAEGAVWKEINIYAPLVTVGSYLIVQDIILDYVKKPWRGPLHAVQRLVYAKPKLKKKLGTFIWDQSIEVYGYTGHAYLLRVA